MENKLLLKVKRIGIFLFFLFFLVNPAYAATFKGKVIDADTKQPIEGAVVVASWHEETATITGPSARFKDVKETLTDKNGEWVIKGPKGGGIAKIFLLIPGMYYTTPPEFIVFKPGYCSWSNTHGIDVCMKKMKSYNFTNSNNIGEIVELPKLTNREDRLKSSAIWPPLMESDKESLKKIKIFLNLLDEENRSLGLSEDPRVKELKNEK